ncbi:MAG: type IV secretion system DNA-binding domain-containing protein [Pirellulales bacterium]
MNARAFHEPAIQFGNLQMTDTDAAGHTLALGSTGSGKSLILRIMMQSVLPLVGKGLNYSALVNDAKQDAMPVLAPYCDPSVICLLSPFDERGYSWNIAKDCDDSITTNELCKALIPEKADSDAFFRYAARQIIWAVITSFILSKLDWTLADVLRAIRNIDICRRTIIRHLETSHIVDTYFQNPKLLGDIQATLAAHLMDFDPIAACWEVAHKQGRSVSLTDTMHSERIIILGNIESARGPIDNINRVIFKRWTDSILSLRDRNGRKFWTFIDELSEAGPLPSIVPFLKKSRSKGGRAVIAAQSISGLQDSNLYGESVTKDMLSCLSNRFIGRLECPFTADYVSQYVGDQEIEQLSSSTTSSSSGRSETTNRNRKIQKAVLPSEVMNVPPCDSEHGLVGLFKLRSSMVCWDAIDSDVLFNQLLVPTDDDVPHFIPRDKRSQYLLPWTKEEEMRFAPMDDATPEFRDLSKIHDFTP